MAVMMLIAWAAHAAQVPPSLPAAVPAQPVAITVHIPADNRPAGPVSYEVQPAAGVQLLSRKTGRLTWDPQGIGALKVPLVLVVDAARPPGVFVPARIALLWPDGRSGLLDVEMVVTAAAGQPRTASAKRLEAEVEAVPDAAPPGGTVRMRVAVYSNEETDERIRLHVAAGPTWKMVDEDDSQREWLVEAYDEVEGEFDLELQADAQPGTRHLVRVLVEVVDEPGVIESHTYVSVVEPGRGRRGGPVVSVTSLTGVSRLGGGGFHEAQAASEVQVSTRFGSQGSASFCYERNIMDNHSNYRYTREPTRVAGTLRHAGWDVSFGNRVPSLGSALAGPFVQGIGAGVRRPAGRLLMDLVVARPVVFGEDAAGHLVRGRVGYRTKKGSLAFAASDFSRPDGRYTTLAPVQQLPLDADEQEEIDVERAFTQRAPSNRVRGAGVEAEFRPSRAHRLTVRAGGVWLSNAAGDRSVGGAGEASYAFSLPRKATFHARWREMPPTLPGVFLMGGERTVDGSLSVVGPIAIVGRGFWKSSETAGRKFQSRGNGASAGVRYMGDKRRLEARWNYRESSFSNRSVRRTVSVMAGTGVGRMTVSANADVGTQEVKGLSSGITFLRADLRWTARKGSVWFAVTHSDSAGGRQERADLVGSFTAGRWEFAGGAWATRGYASGGRPGVWTTLGIPAGRELMVVVGLDRAPISWTAEPTLRATFAIRKRFAVALPFGAPTDPDSPGEQR